MFTYHHHTLCLWFGRRSFNGKARCRDPVTCTDLMHEIVTAKKSVLNPRNGTRLSLSLFCLTNSCSITARGSMHPSGPTLHPLTNDSSPSCWKDLPCHTRPSLSSCAKRSKPTHTYTKILMAGKKSSFFIQSLERHWLTKLVSVYQSKHWHYPLELRSLKNQILFGQLQNQKRIVACVQTPSSL